MLKKILIFVFFVMSCITIYANPKTNVISGNDLPKVYIQTFDQLKKTNIFSEKIWRDTSRSLPPTDGTVNIFTDNYWSIDKIMYIYDITTWLNDSKVFNPEVRNRLQNSAAFMLGGRVWLNGNHPIYLKMEKEYNEGRDLYTPILTTILAHEIAHTMFADHATVYAIGIKFLKQAESMVQAKMRLQVRGYTVAFANMVSFLLKDQILNHDKEKIS